MGVGIDVDVLGPVRITVDGAVVVPPAQVAPLLVALAVPAEPIRKLDLAREVLYLSPGSIDSRLSRLHRLLGLDTPLHRVPVARSGLVELDRGVVSVDADRFRSLVAEAESMIERGQRGRGSRGRCSAPTSSGAPVRPRGRHSATRTPGHRSARHAMRSSSNGGVIREIAGRSAWSAPRRIPLTGWSSGPGRGTAAPSVWHTRIVHELDSGGARGSRAALSEWTRNGPVTAASGPAAGRRSSWRGSATREGIAVSAPRVTDPAADPPPQSVGRTSIAELGGAHASGGERARWSASPCRRRRVGQDPPARRTSSITRDGARTLGRRTSTSRRRRVSTVCLRRALTPLWQTSSAAPIRRRRSSTAPTRSPRVVAGPTLDEPKGVDGREPISPARHAAGLAGAVLRAIDQPVLLLLDNVHRATRSYWR